MSINSSLKLPVIVFKMPNMSIMSFFAANDEIKDLSHNLSLGMQSSNTVNGGKFYRKTSDTVDSYGLSVVLYRSYIMQRDTLQYLSLDSFIEEVRMGTVFSTLLTSNITSSLEQVAKEYVPSSGGSSGESYNRTLFRSIVTSFSEKKINFNAFGKETSRTFDLKFSVVNPKRDLVMTSKENFKILDKLNSLIGL